MATNSLADNVTQAVADFRAIKTAIEGYGVTVSGPTSGYAALMGDAANKHWFDNAKDRSTFAYAFYGNSTPEGVTTLDFGNLSATAAVTDFQQMLANNARIKIVDNLNTTAATSIYMMCQGATELEELRGFISLYNASNTNQTKYAFSGAPKLKRIDFADTIRQNSLNLSGSPLLERDTLLTMINCLEDKTGDTSATWAVEIGATNLAKLSAEEIAIATAKNWSIA